MINIARFSIINFKLKFNDISKTKNRYFNWKFIYLYIQIHKEIGLVFIICA